MQGHQNDLGLVRIEGLVDVWGGGNGVVVLFFVKYVNLLQLAERRLKVFNVMEHL